MSFSPQRYRLPKLNRRIAIVRGRRLIHVVTFPEGDGALRACIDVQLEYIGPRIVSDRIEVVSATNSRGEIEFGGDNAFLIP